MAIYIGANKLKGGHIGAAKIKEVYVGLNKVYSGKQIILSFDPYTNLLGTAETDYAREIVNTDRLTVQNTQPQAVPGSWISGESFDVTGFDKLKITCKASRTDTGNRYIGLTSKASGSLSANDFVASDMPTTVLSTLEIDVRGLTGAYHIGVRIPTGATVNIDITEIVLE